MEKGGRGRKERESKGEGEGNWERQQRLEALEKGARCGMSITRKKKVRGEEQRKEWVEFGKDWENCFFWSCLPE